MIHCPPLGIPVGGQIAFSTVPSPNYELGTIATYSCNSGLALLGSSAIRTCDGDGSNSIGNWNGNEPSCESKFVNLAEKECRYAIS